MNAKTRRLVIREAKRFDPEEWEQAAVLLASAIVGPKPDVIARELGLPRATCRAYGAMARAHGVWVGGRVIAGGDWWGDDGGIVFKLDLAVMSGLLDRR